MSETLASPADLCSPHGVDPGDVEVPVPLASRVVVGRSSRRGWDGISTLLNLARPSPDVQIVEHLSSLGESLLTAWRSAPGVGSRAPHATAALFDQIRMIRSYQEMRATEDANLDPKLKELFDSFALD